MHTAYAELFKVESQKRRRMNEKLLIFSCNSGVRRILVLSVVRNRCWNGKRRGGDMLNILTLGRILSIERL